MRFLGFVILVAGLFAAYGHRFVDFGFSDFEVGRYEVYRQNTGYVPVTVELTPLDAPLRSSFELSVPETAFDTGGTSTLTLVVNNEDGTVTTAVVEISPETATVTEDGILRVEATMLSDLGNGRYTFVTGEGDRDELGIAAVDLLLEGNAGGITNQYQPVGYGMILAGLVLYLIGGRNSRPRGNEKRERKRVSKTSSIGYRQPKPKREKKKPSMTWGRGGDKD